jgi:Fic family protein
MDFPGKTTGRLCTYVNRSVASESYHCCIPPSLPPNPPLALDPDHYDLMEQANRALGRLDGLTALLPDTSLFIYFYVRKEALLSSQIEGTQSSFSDLLLYESKEVPGVPIEDVQEVSNYVAAMTHGLKRLREGCPLSLRLMREIHGILLAKGRGADKTPGEFRRSQNWIGGTRPGNAMFVPPPAEDVMKLMGDLEKFLHGEPVKMPVLIKAALAHVQFETIHPFLDGNGRVGRLLITFLLCAEKALSEPILYLSLYFKTHRQEYYEHLQRVRTEGDWEQWLRFFLTGVMQTAEQATDAARSILSLFEKDRAKIEKLGRPAGSALRMHEYLQRKPITSVTMAAKKLGLTEPTIRASLSHMQKLGIVKEMTGRQRNRLFVYRRYLDILDEGTEPLHR